MLSIVSNFVLWFQAMTIISVMLINLEEVDPDYFNNCFVLLVLLDTFLVLLDAFLVLRYGSPHS